MSRAAVNAFLLIGAALALLLLAPLARAASPGSSEFRGYVAVNRLLRERLFLPGSTFELGQFINQEYDPQAGNLLDLLGTYKTGFGVAGFRNGKPNALNMLLWHTLFAALARDIAGVCAGEPNVFNPSFVARVRPLCAGPLASDDLFVFWTALLGVDAPLEEYALWEAFAMSAPMREFQGADYVESLAVSVLNNPYFLLRH